MAAAVILILVAGAVVAVLAKIVHGLVGLARQDIAEHGAVTPVTKTKIGVVALLAGLVLLWLLLGLLAGDNTPVY